SLLVIGGGIIGCEFASIFSSFGSAVTIVEVCDHLIPGTDTDMARKLETSFRKKGIKVHTKADPAAFDLSAYEKVLVCVGRVPRTEGVQDAGIAVERGRIVVDDFMMTSVPGVYAAGDCTGRLMLAHVAAAQGRVAARNCAAGKPAEKISYSGIPSCIFTSPEIACVGISEDEAMKRGITVKEYGFDLMGSGMAQVMGETEGMIKILADIRTDEVVGAFVIGPNACELGGTLTLAVQTSMKISDLKRTVFAHPSLTEAISETLI
ncbi:MAG: dihydrolipoyl dehydrogenase family protein, partial [Deltaproteobacteria bacterium]